MKTTFLKQIIVELILIGILIMSCLVESSAAKVKVLFIGNSYTYVNDLPSLINELAKSTGDEITYSSNTPGGSTFQGHSSDATTLSLIKQGGWDYVVLQEQSQRPSFSDWQVEWQVYPYAKKLDSLVKVFNPCAKTVFYMTWGRKYGDQDICPYINDVCTYRGMDDLLQLRYANMADSNNAVLCPVAKVWRALISNYPSINLYSGDNSHPSVEGSYAAACAFYTVFFKKNPALCTYTTSLSATDAAIIKTASKEVVYDQLDNWYSYYPNVKASYIFSVSSKEVTCINSSENAESYSWDFGDGSHSVSENPSHEFTADGSYKVKLIAKKCSEVDSVEKTITIGTTELESSISERKIILYPNPAKDVLYIESLGNYDEIVITNTIGQPVKHFASNDRSLTSIDIHDLDNGIYVVNIRSQTGSMTMKFYKK